MDWKVRENLGKSTIGWVKEMLQEFPVELPFKQFDTWITRLMRNIALDLMKNCMVDFVKVFMNK